MAHTKAQKATKGNRDSHSKRLGVKVFGGGQVQPGFIIIRQKGTKVNAGFGVQMSRDHTLIALKKGVVKFYQRQGEKFVSVV